MILLMLKFVLMIYSEKKDLKMKKKNQMEFESKLISVMQKVENQKKQLSEIEKNTKFSK